MVQILDILHIVVVLDLTAGVVQTLDFVGPASFDRPYGGNIRVPAIVYAILTVTRLSGVDVQKNRNFGVIRILVGSDWHSER